MDLLDVAILALRLVLVALLYLFLATVLRMATRAVQLAPERQPRAPAATAGRLSSLHLVVIDGGGSTLARGQVIEIGDGATLGRTEPAQVKLADAAVSSEHARLSRVGRTWVIVDLGSTNGTRVNDVAAQPQAPVHNGDVLALGNVRLKVVTR